MENQVEEIKEIKDVDESALEEVFETVESPKQPGKLSYEQLEEIARQQSQQSQQLYEELQKARTNDLYVRVDFLFKVVENRQAFPTPFVRKCTQEIELLMTIPEQVKKS